MVPIIPGWGCNKGVLTCLNFSILKSAIPNFYCTRTVSLENQNLSYKTVLGLEKDPFSPESDPLFYYAFESFEQRMTVLKSLAPDGYPCIGHRRAGKWKDNSPEALFKL